MSAGDISESFSNLFFFWNSRLTNTEKIWINISHQLLRTYGKKRLIRASYFRSRWCLLNNCKVAHNGNYREMEAYHCGWSSTESVNQLAYHNCILVLSVKRQKLPDAHFETSMFNVLKPNIHGVIGFCITIVLSGDKYERNTAKTLQVFQCPLSSRSRY